MNRDAPDTRERRKGWPLWISVVQWSMTIGFFSALAFIVFVAATSGKHSAGLFG